MSGLEILFGVGFSLLGIEKLISFIKKRKSINSVGGDGNNNTNVMNNSNNNTTVNTVNNANTLVSKPIVSVTSHITLSVSAIKLLQEFADYASNYPNGFSLSPDSEDKLISYQELDGLGLLTQVQGTSGQPLRFEINSRGLTEARKYQPYEKYQDTRKTLESYFQKATLTNKNQNCKTKTVLINSTVKINEFTDLVLKNMQGEKLLKWENKHEGNFPLVELNPWYVEQLLS